MQKYDLTLILNSTLEKSDLDKVLEKIKKAVTDPGGKIENIEEWGKKEMAYDIKKQKQGVYYNLLLEMEEKEAVTLEGKLRIEQNLLRHLLVRKE